MKCVPRLGATSEPTRQLEALDHALAARGYQSHRDGAEVSLGQLSLYALAAGHRELVYRMNLALLQGVLKGIEAKHLEARFDPHPDRCGAAISPFGQSGPRSDCDQVLGRAWSASWEPAVSGRITARRSAAAGQGL